VVVRADVVSKIVASLSRGMPADRARTDRSLTPFCRGWSTDRQKCLPRAGDRPAGEAVALAGRLVGTDLSGVASFRRF